MANHNSAIKRNRQNTKRNARNNACRTQVKTVIKKTITALEGKDKKQAQESFKLATTIISKVSSKGVIHKRKASRKISRLAKKLNQLASVG